MLNSPLLSIVIPVYNAEKTLEKCVDSVRMQTYSPKEIILVNDGSKDNSADLCDRMARSFPEIKVVHQTNGGPNKARNTGLDHARGKFVAFVDADDVFYTPTTLEDNMRFFDSDPEIDIVSFPQYREELSADGHIILETNPAQFKSCRLSDKRIIITNWFNGNLIAGHFPCKIFRKSIFDGWRLTEAIRFTEDHYNIPDLLEHCRAVQISGVGGYVYKYNEASAIHTEHTDSKRFDQLRSEVKLYHTLRRFKDVLSYMNAFYFQAIENAYYLLGTPYEAEAIAEVCSLGRNYRKSSGRLFPKALSLMTMFLGFKYGLKLTHLLMTFKRK